MLIQTHNESMNKFQTKIKNGGYLLPSNDNTGFTLNDHIFCATEIQSYWNKTSRLVKVIHDGSYLLRFEVNKNQYIRIDQQK